MKGAGESRNQSTVNGLAPWLTRQWLVRSWPARLLWPISLIFGLLVAARRWAVQRGWMPWQRLPVPVVVVGNRIVGGAGKTPTVIAVLRHLQQKGWTPGLLSRGHGRVAPAATAGHPAPPLILDAKSSAHSSARVVGDEPWLIWRHTACPVAIAADRVAGGRALLAAHPNIDILVCDDGLQHLALGRDVEIVVFDERGAGNGWLLPAGPLREPISAPNHPACAQAALVLYNAAQPSTPLPGYTLKRKLGALQPHHAWWAGQTHQPLAPGDLVPPALRSQPCWAVAGIAQPERFFEALRALGLAPTPCPLADHDRLDTLPWPPEVRHVIVTEKDAVKLRPELLAAQRLGTQVWVAPLHIEIDPAFWRALDARLASV